MYSGSLVRSTGKLLQYAGLLNATVMISRYLIHFSMRSRIFGNRTQFAALRFFYNTKLLKFYSIPGFGIPVVQAWAPLHKTLRLVPPGAIFCRFLRFMYIQKCAGTLITLLCLSFPSWPLLACTFGEFVMGHVIRCA